MGELRTPPSFEARRAQMAGIVDHVMSNNSNPRLRVGWTFTPYTSIEIHGEQHRAFYPEHITAVRKAASTALTAESKKELLDQARIYTKIALPDDPGRRALAQRSIQQIAAKITIVGPIFMPPTLDLKKQFAMEFAKLELLADTEGIARTAAEGYGNEPMTERLQFVAGLTGIVMSEVDELLSNNPAPQRIVRRPTVSARMEALNKLLRRIDTDLAEAS